MRFASLATDRLHINKIIMAHLINRSTHQLQLTLKYTPYHCTWFVLTNKAIFLICSYLHLGFVINILQDLEISSINRTKN